MNEIVKAFDQLNTTGEFNTLILETKTHSCYIKIIEDAYTYLDSNIIITDIYYREMKNFINKLNELSYLTITLVSDIP
jgi:hypothetical protein